MRVKNVHQNSFCELKYMIKPKVGSRRFQAPEFYVLAIA